MKLIAYARVSTEDQGQNGHSIDEQHERIVQYCAALGHEVKVTVSEVGVSGAVHLEKRPEGEKVLKMLAAKSYGVEGVIVYDLSRLTRSIEDMVRLMARSEAEGWTFISLKESVDTKSPAGRLVVHVMASFNEFLRDNISLRTKDALARLRRKGRKTGPDAPFGFSHTDGGFVVPNELERRAVDFVANTWKLSTARAAKLLNDGYAGMDLAVHPRRKTRWVVDDVKRIRSNVPYHVRDAEIAGDHAGAQARLFSWKSTPWGR